MKAMKALTLPSSKWDSVVGNSDYISQEKLDGYRGLLCVNNFDIRLFSTQGINRIKQIPYIARSIKSSPILPYTVLDGEIYCKGMTSAEISGLMHRKDIIEANLQLEYHIFDILSFSGVVQSTSSFTHRNKVLQENVKPLISSPFVKFLETRKDHVTHFQEVLDDGGEGIMLKNIHSLYYEGKRPANCWYKIKKQDTWDVKIIGFTSGEGKYDGLIGSFIYELQDENGLLYEGSCSGMNDIIRRDMTFSPHLWLGEIVEIEGMELTKDGVIRHPRFIRIRHK